MDGCVWNASNRLKGRTYVNRFKVDVKRGFTRQYVLSRHPCSVVKDASEAVAGFDQETYISEASYVDA